MRHKKSSKKQDKPTTFGDSLRERISLRSSTEQDIGAVWEEQRLRKLEARRLDRDLKNAKEQTKELKKKLKQNYIGTQWSLAKKHGSKLKKFSKYTKIVSKNLNKIRFSKKQLAFTSLVLILISLTILKLGDKSDTSTLGVTTDSSGSTSTSSENVVERNEVSFEVMLPNGVNESELKTVSRKSPAGDIIFTYQETKGDSVIEVTQQQLPASFKGAEEAELQKSATELQATNVIQINDAKIYHGLSEKAGVQSLITIKNDVLIFIRSSTKHSDEFWTAYYLSLE